MPLGPLMVIGGAFVLATVSSATLVGVEGRPIEVEIHASGRGSLSIVGLPTPRVACPVTG